MSQLGNPGRLDVENAVQFDHERWDTVLQKGQIHPPQWGLGQSPGCQIFHKFKWFCLKPGTAWPRKTRLPQPNYRPGLAAAICKGPVASNTARLGVTQPRGAFELSIRQGV